MTTSSLAVSLLLLLLSLLLSQAQGIRLEKGFSSVRQQNKNIQEEENNSMKRSNIGAAGFAGEPSNTASSGIRTRKLISVTSPSSATTTSKNEKKGRKNRDDSEPKGENVNSHGGEDGNGKAKSPVVSKQQEAAAAHQHYPDLADMMEMDYSPAKKKPPIHN